jgi:acyl carrier protein
VSDRRALVLDVLALVSGVPRDSLRPEQDLVADLGLDSPKAVRLLVELEERLGAEIDDAEAAGLSTVGDLLRLAELHA